MNVKLAQIGNLGTGETKEAAESRARECLLKAGLEENHIRTLTVFQTLDGTNMAEVLFTDADDVQCLRIALQANAFSYIPGKTVWID